MQQQCLKDPNKDIGLDFGLDLDVNFKVGVWSEARGKHQLKNMYNQITNFEDHVVT